MEDILYYLAWIYVAILNAIKSCFCFVLELAEQYIVVRILLIAWVIGFVICLIKEFSRVKFDVNDFKEKSKEYTKNRDGIDMGGNVKYRTFLKRPLYRYTFSCDELSLDRKLRSRMYDWRIQELALEESNTIVHEKSLISALTGSLYKGEDNGRDYLTYLLPIYKPYNILYTEKDPEVWKKDLEKMNITLLSHIEKIHFYMQDMARWLL